MSKSEYLKESFPRFYLFSKSKHNAAKPKTRKSGCDQQEKKKKMRKRGSNGPNGNEMEIKKPGFYNYQNIHFLY
jgi:hypothetical protein